MKTENPERTFSEFLRSKGFKITRPRSLVVEEALHTKGHFTADDLWMKSFKRDQKISRATVYRTLQLLTQSRLIESRDFEQGKLYYEQMVGHAHHDHLICLECGKITEFENPQIEDLQDQVAQKYHFKIVSHSHKLYGVCSICRRGHSKGSGKRLRVKLQ